MQKYGDSGDNIVSLDAEFKSNTILYSVGSTPGRFIDLIDYSNMLIDPETSGIMKDITESFIKDTVFKMIREEKLSKTDANIFLHTYGIDEFWPAKTVKEIKRIYRRIPKVDEAYIRSRRYRVTGFIINQVKKELENV